MHDSGLSLSRRTVTQCKCYPQCCAYVVKTRFIATCLGLGFGIDASNALHYLCNQSRNGCRCSRRQWRGPSRPARVKRVRSLPRLLSHLSQLRPHRAHEATSLTDPLHATRTPRRHCRVTGQSGSSKRSARYDMYSAEADQVACQDGCQGEFVSIVHLASLSCRDR